MSLIQPDRAAARNGTQDSLSTPGRPGATRSAARLARYGLLFVAPLLSGCATLSGFGVSTKEPVPTDRFVLTDPNTQVVGEIQYVIAKEEDTLPDFARRYGLGHDEIVAANPGVDPWLPGAGTRVILPTQFVLPDAPRKGIVLNLATLRLFYFPERAEGEPQIVVTHPVGIGREGWRTPVGQMRITDKVENPTWRPTASVRREHAEEGRELPAVVPAGPDNPLGLYAMRLSRPKYLLHGTNKPFGVGMRVSHGCVRLYPEDIEALFKEVPVGTSVQVINQPYLAGWKDGELYLEAHAPLAEDARQWKGSLKPMEKAVKAVAGNAPAAVDWQRAEQLTREARGIPTPISPGSPTLDDVLAGARHVPRTPDWEQVAQQDI